MIEGGLKDAAQTQKLRVLQQNNLRIVGCCYYIASWHSKVCNKQRTNEAKNSKKKINNKKTINKSLKKNQQKNKPTKQTSPKNYLLKNTTLHCFSCHHILLGFFKRMKEMRYIVACQY